MKLDYSLFEKSNEKPLDRICPDGGFTGIFRTIGCVGDSLSSGEFESDNNQGGSGYHDMFEYSWGQYIGRMTGSTVYNFSRGGMSTFEYSGFAEANRYWNPKYACDAYIIALSVNDVSAMINNKETYKLGEESDIDFNDYKNNKFTFMGCYAAIIQRLKTIQPRAKFFLVTVPDADYNEERREYNLKIRDFLYYLSEKLENTYVIDLWEYAPKYDEKFKQLFFLRGHMNPMGYLFTAKIISSYIDYIVRHNMDDFREVCFIGTDLKG